MTINIADNNKESTKFLISYILLLFEKEDLYVKTQNSSNKTLQVAVQSSTRMAHIMPKQMIGKIVSVDWNAINKDGGDDKDTLSRNGGYKMVEYGGAQAEWHEQAEKVEAYLVEKQDPTDIKYKDNDGHTDAISGATIKVKKFFDFCESRKLCIYV